MSDSITVDEFLVYCPEFSDLEDTVIEFYLDQALNYTGDFQNGWGSLRRFQSAQAWCTGHLLTKYEAILDSSTGAAQNPKVITQKTVGDVSISWGGANLIPSDYTADEFNTTTYGYRYLQLREQRPRGRMICI